MRLADRAVVGIMTPRTDVVWIDITASAEAIKERLISTPHSRLPVGEGSTDKMIGVVQTRELLAAVLKGKPLDIVPHIRKAPMIPETSAALDVLTVLRSADVPMALIHDEYGDFEGLVTPADMLEAIAGRIQVRFGRPRSACRRTRRWLLAVVGRDAGRRDGG